jgi:hypothetical protein
MVRLNMLQKKRLIHLKQKESPLACPDLFGERGKVKTNRESLICQTRGVFLGKGSFSVF